MYVIPNNYYNNLNNCMYKITLKEKIIDDTSKSIIIQNITDYRAFITQIYNLLTNDGKDTITTFPNTMNNNYILSFENNNIVLISKNNKTDPKLQFNSKLQLYNICNINNFIDHTNIFNTKLKENEYIHDMCYYLMKKYYNFFYQKLSKRLVDGKTLHYMNINDFYNIITNINNTIDLIDGSYENLSEKNLYSKSHLPKFPITSKSFKGGLNQSLYQKYLCYKNKYYV